MNITISQAYVDAVVIVLYFNHNSRDVLSHCQEFVAKNISFRGILRPLLLSQVKLVCIYLSVLARGGHISVGDLAGVTTLQLNSGTHVVDPRDVAAYRLPGPQAVFAFPRQ